MTPAIARATDLKFRVRFIVFCLGFALLPAGVTVVGTPDLKARSGRFKKNLVVPNPAIS
jgi:hypothetical protein